MNPGNTAFKRVLNSKYVDKTEMIEYINSVIDTEERFICVTRPRRFGKTIAANMLSAYYSSGCDSRTLFDRLRVSRCDSYLEHLNKYTVISFSMNTFSVDCESIKDSLNTLEAAIVRDLLRQYPIDVEVQGITDTLLEVADKYSLQFIVLIDEWDAFFRDFPEDTQGHKIYVNFLRKLFKSDLSDNAISLVYLTGILPIKKYKTESSLNNFDEFTMLNAWKLAPFVGFTEGEVKRLCNDCGIDINKVKEWYDGYLLDGMHVFNPKAVMEVLRKGVFESYWSSTGTFTSLADYVSGNFNGLKDSITEMIGGGRCKVDVRGFNNDLSSINSRDDVLTVLIHLGYLAYDKTNREVFIPNKEIREEFTIAVRESHWDEVWNTVSRSQELLKATPAGDAATVANAIEEIHLANTSIIKYNDENSLSCVITLAYYAVQDIYTVIRELPSGKGFADIVFLPKFGLTKIPMLVELKWDKSADTALKQIKEKGYLYSLKDYEEVLIVGINYDKETKRHECKIERIPLVERNLINLNDNIGFQHK